MKFTDGYWLMRPGVSALHPVEVVDLEVATDGTRMTVHAATSVVRGRADTLNRPLISVGFDAPAEGVIRVRITHHAGWVARGPRFDVADDPAHAGRVEQDDTQAVLHSGSLCARVSLGTEWHVDFVQDGRVLTSSLPRSVGAVHVEDDGDYVHEQLAIAPGERVYGLGERFGPLAKNGQSVDIWQADGGTSSEQAYKNVPFFVSSQGYGVLVAHPERVSFEVASEVVARTQFSVPGQVLEYYLIAGPTPKDVLTRYTALAGRPPAVPAWSYGLWLSTSFTTDYDERTVTGFLDEMARRALPLSVFHFDCFWMRAFHWCDFVWDPATFPDPSGMIRRLHERGLRVCVWINPYIAQRSALFAEGAERGYLLRRTDGSVWQWDLWQAGMGLVDFTNPEAAEWFVGKLEALLDDGVDCFKTDFGERIPVEGVAWHDGSAPEAMHNYYTQLYNRTVFELLRQRRGEGQAVLFARSATAGGQQFPVHWGGDCDSTFASMAETLRGGLSLAMSGFGYWSHDIGGFEGTPDPTVFKRWLAFGLLSSHSRLHGSGSVRVPWAFDEEAVDLTRRFTRLKLALMPYLGQVAREVVGAGVPMLRPTVLEFPQDRATREVDTQYLLGPALLVAPVLSADGSVEVYVPEGRWTSLLDGSVVDGPRWIAQTHAIDSLPLLVRPDTVLPLGAGEPLGPEYDWADGVGLALYELADGHDSTLVVPASDAGVGAADATFRIRRTGPEVTVTTDSERPWAVRVGDVVTHASAGARTLQLTLP